MFPTIVIKKHNNIVLNVFTRIYLNIDIVLCVQNIIVQNCFFTTNVIDSIYLCSKYPSGTNKIENVRTFNFPLF